MLGAHVWLDQRKDVKKIVGIGLVPRGGVRHALASPSVRCVLVPDIVAPTRRRNRLFVRKPFVLQQFDLLMTGIHKMSESSGSAEFNYYRDQFGNEDDGMPVDLREWINLLGAAKTFSAGARYSIVDAVLGSASKVPSLLEIGCGAGENSAYMCRYAHQVTGVDIYLPPHLRRERSDDLPLQFIEFNANDRFAPANGSFDVVVAMMVMEHVFDPFHFVAECERVLKPGGRLFLNVPLITNWKHRLTLLCGGLPKTTPGDPFKKLSWDGGHLHLFSVAAVEKLLDHGGFETLKKSSVGRGYAVKDLWLNLLAAELSVCARKRQ